MRTRAVASVALAGLVLLGTTACNFMAPQATTDVYEPSDGVSTTVGNVRVLNAMVISDGEGEGNLVANLLNQSDDRVTVSLQYESAAGKVDTQVSLPGNELTALGHSDGETLLLEDMDAKPGDLLPVFVQYGSNTGKQLLVPVLDGTLPEYSPLVP